MKTLFLSFILISAALSLRAEKPVNETWTGVAIEGYDPVAYFESGAPAKGDRARVFEWNGATWRFASEANLAKFKEAPEKYAPQFGGYCAWAVSQGYTAGIDPKAWKIVEGKLYLNYSLDVQKKWEEDIPGHIKAARVNWPRILAK